ncbi:peptidoglycan-associated lipoprotein Pal [Zophobihabitans entericus]|uniref:Peptidoglycan-associated lipoprotein n=1 Tax=Zophobihabitans entericus TaxID=1635327 RepID=A0A6G9ICT6_9GAMM|nr:peptidoglycan-associated lipoprotein Pal [Zophobihabitans entericus]QIQ21629.1 peptidoglycan-associated lipoprotein Pal [Zophobihabitans entericus]
MQFSKMVKGVLFALPIIAITACSSTGSSSESTDGSASANAQTSAQLQKLQQVNTVYFDFDKYNIKQDFTAALDQHAEFLRTHSSFSIVIEGHADERGTPEYNIALGERRAAAVKAYLQGRGVAESQISIVSYGKAKPAVLGHDERAYAQNRRAVIVY